MQISPYQWAILVCDQTRDAAMKTVEAYRASVESMMFEVREKTVRPTCTFGGAILNVNGFDSTGTALEATLNNAKRARELVRECGSLAAYFWRFEPPASERPRRMTHAALMKLAKTPTSTALSKDLLGRGWKFVGPTTCYAFMQAMGLVNDHLEGCSARPAVEAARRGLARPG